MNLKLKNSSLKFCLLSLYVSFAFAEVSEKTLNVTLDSLESSSLEYLTTLSAENVSEIFTEAVTEHISVLKWKKTDAMVKKVAGMAYKQILPTILRGFVDIDISPACSRNLMRFLTGFKQMKTWAFASKLAAVYLSQIDNRLF